MIKSTWSTTLLLVVNYCYVTHCRYKIAGYRDTSFDTIELTTASLSDQLSRLVREVCSPETWTSPTAEITSENCAQVHEKWVRLESIWLVPNPVSVEASVLIYKRAELWLRTPYRWRQEGSAECIELVRSSVRSTVERKIRLPYARD